MKPIDRKEILSAIRARIEPDPDVLAMFEGGSAAFRRSDEWSDIDLQIITAENAVARAAELAEEALAGVAEIEMRVELPMPTWHGHYQIFYRFANASPFLLLDLVIMQVSSPNKFLEREIHGERVVHFDKGDYTHPPALDEAEFALSRARAMDLQRGRFEIGRLFVTKEINRSNPIGALAFYYSMTLNPLVMALRTQHAPYHYNFGTHSIQHDLPGDVLARLEQLYFVKDGEDLRNKHAEATQWFDELTRE